jgi:hypothetical protein
MKIYSIILLILFITGNSNGHTISTTSDSSKPQQKRQTQKTPLKRIQGSIYQAPAMEPLDEFLLQRLDEYRDIIYKSGLRPDLDGLLPEEIEKEIANLTRAITQRLMQKNYRLQNWNADYVVKQISALSDPEKITVQKFLEPYYRQFKTPTFVELQSIPDLKLQQISQVHYILEQATKSWDEKITLLPHTQQPANCRWILSPHLDPIRLPIKEIVLKIRYQIIFGSSGSYANQRIDPSVSTALTNEPDSTYFHELLHAYLDQQTTTDALQGVSTQFSINLDPFTHPNQDPYSVLTSLDAGQIQILENTKIIPSYSQFLSQEELITWAQDASALSVKLNKALAIWMDQDIRNFEPNDIPYLLDIRIAKQNFNLVRSRYNKLPVTDTKTIELYYLLKQKLNHVEQLAKKFLELSNTILLAAKSAQFMIQDQKIQFHINTFSSNINSSLDEARKTEITVNKNGGLVSFPIAQSEMNYFRQSDRMERIQWIMSQINPAKLYANQLLESIAALPSKTREPLLMIDIFEIKAIASEVHQHKVNFIEQSKTQ